MCRKRLKLSNNRFTWCIDLCQCYHHVSTAMWHCYNSVMTTSRVWTFHNLHAHPSLSFPLSLPYPGLAVFPVRTHSALECCSVVIIKIPPGLLHQNYCFSYSNVFGTVPLHGLGLFLLWIFSYVCVHCHVGLHSLGAFALLLFNGAGCVMYIFYIFWASYTEVL
jgi:hypothetical protein